MDLGQFFLNLFNDYTLRTVALGSAVLGITSGTLGSYAVLRRQSLLGDAISHAALPGVVLAFLLTRSKIPLVLVLGAAFSGWLATLWMLSIIKKTRIKEDTALGLILSVFFGLGMMLLTFTQRLPDARQAGLDHFLFGQAAALLESDVVTMAILGAVTLILVMAFWKELKLLSFDRGFAASLGLRIGALDVLLTMLLVVAIVIGLQAVGVVLMSAMIVAPAAAARQWTDRLGIMVALAGAFGAAAGIFGTALSSTTTGLSTGPTIVLSATAIVLVSLFFAPNRGLFWNVVRRQRSQNQLRSDTLLRGLQALAAEHNDPYHPHPFKALQAMTLGSHGVAQSLKRLEADGLVRRLGQNEWALTSAGFQKTGRSDRSETE